MDIVAVVDYGTSNLRSVAKALEHVAQDRCRVQVTSDPAVIREADRVVFPGQGAIGQCMESLRRSGLDKVLRDCVQEKPYLGLCLGLQSLFDESEEDGGTKGLGIIPGHVVRFPHPHRDPATGERLKVPHMGWNEVTPTREHSLWQGIAPGERFYFVHSFYVVPTDPAAVAATTNYGLDFACAAATGNIFAVQFHPEKSQHAGLRLLENFLGWRPV
jgi:glutamine amidotransferase